MKQNGKTKLTITVGDFGVLSDGQRYHDANIEFVEEASNAIKKLAQSNA